MCPYVHLSIRASRKSFPDSNEIRCVGWGRWVMHDGVLYDPIQDQVLSSHTELIFLFCFFFEICLLACRQRYYQTSVLSAISWNSLRLPHCVHLDVRSFFNISSLRYTGSSSAIDLRLCDPSLYLDFTWSVHIDLCGNDYYPLLIQSNQPTDHDALSYWKLDWADCSVYIGGCMVITAVI